MYRNVRMGLLLAAGILLMAGSAYMAWRAGSAQRAPQASVDDPIIRFASNPEPAPRMEIRDLSGKVTSMDALKGKVVLVNFWATWCPPCRMEIPELIRLQQQYRDQMQIIGVSEDDEADQVHAFVQKVGINYPVVMAEPDLIAAYGGVAALPTTFVIDTEGRVVQRHLGLLDAATAELEIRSLTGLPANARVEHFEDTGQVFSKNVDKATELPDVDFTGLSPEQKKQALRRMNTENCTCGCKQMLAQCRLDDSTCDTSKERAAAIVKEIKEGAASQPAPATPTATP